MSNVKVLLVAIAVIILGFLVWFYSPPETPSNNVNIEIETMNDLTPTIVSNPTVVLKTNKGDIEIELFVDKMPITAGNFLKLAKEGFYNETKFHRVINNFMVQGGDPNSRGEDTSTYGQGGPGYAIADEFVEGLSNVRGTISMANSGPNSGGSQFFINLVDNTFLDFDKEPLTSRHPVFGKVVGGMEVVDIIAREETGARDIPVEPIVIKEVVVKE